MESMSPLMVFCFHPLLPQPLLLGHPATLGHTKEPCGQSMVRDTSLTLCVSLELILVSDTTTGAGDPWSSPGSSSHVETLAGHMNSCPITQWLSRPAQHLP